MPRGQYAGYESGYESDDVQGWKSFASVWPHRHLQQEALVGAAFSIGRRRTHCKREVDEEERTWWSWLCTPQRMIDAWSEEIRIGTDWNTNRSVIDVLCEVYGCLLKFFYCFCMNESSDDRGRYRAKKFTAMFGDGVEFEGSNSRTEKKTAQSDRFDTLLSAK